MPDALDVPVAGGLLRVATWPGTGPPVLAIHGITSSSRSWPLLAQELDRPVVAPDLRGRGGPTRLPGPVGLVAHADDCAAALREVTDQPAVVVGHSMGGFVATCWPPGTPSSSAHSCSSTEASRSRPSTRRRRSPACSRSRTGCARRTRGRATETGSATTRRSPATGRPRSRSTPTTTCPTTPADRAPTPRPSRRTSSTCSRAQPSRRPSSDPQHPRVFLHAPRGFADDPPGLYPQPTVDAFAARWPDLDVRPVPDVNHYTIVLSRRGAAAVADAVRDLA